MTPVRAGDTAGVAALTAGATLDIGCGARKRNPAWIGIDVLPLDGVDIVGDALEALCAMQTHSVARIFTSHFLEHVDNPAPYLTEFARVTRPGGQITIVVPHHSNAYFYSDYTHRSAFGLYSLSYFVENRLFRRTVPIYGDPLDMCLHDVMVIFKSPRPFYVRYAFRWIVQRIVNSSRWSREFYEENLSGLISAYELRFELTQGRWAEPAPRSLGN